MCCTRLAGNAGHKKSQEIRRLGTIAHRIPLGGQKEEEETTGQQCNGLPYYVGRP